MATPPKNAAIRMRADPMCDKVNGGQPVVQQTVVASSDGSLANVFVQLLGDFPDRRSPTDPVIIDQRGCVYVPRVIGLQIGQPLRVRNSDPGLHNVHGISSGPDDFNVGQPMAGMVNTMHLTTEGIMRLQCDVHTWMIAFVVVVRHPYFAVTSAPGTFELRHVPVGTYKIRAWHEQFGELMSTVRVDAAQVSVVDFVYTGEAKAASTSARLVEVH
jgi:hypothetical protein